MSRFRKKAAMHLALVLSLVLFGQGPVMVMAEEGFVSISSNKWAVIPEFASAPTIDGDLSESEWSSAAVLDDFRTAYYMQPVSNGPSYRVGYDSNYLYVGGTIAGDDITELRRIEVVLIHEGEPDVAYVAAIPVSDPARPMTTNWNLKRTGTTVAINDITSEQNVDASNLTVEASIPLDLLGLAPPSGTEWRMNMIHVYDINTKPLISWAPIQKSRFWVTAGSYGLQGNVADHARLGSLYFGGAPNGEEWEPELASLEYVSFNEKRLSFETPVPARNHYELKWKSPDQPWTTLTSVTASATGSRTVLDFSHPDPLSNGQYQLQLLAYTSVPSDGSFAVLTFDREGLIAAGLATIELPPAGPVTNVAYSLPSTAVQQIMSYIPDRSGFRYVGLPDNPEWIPDGLYVLSEDNQRLLAKSNGREYPNEDYPEDKVMIVKDKNGQDVSYPYYEGPDGKQYFFSAHKWYLQRSKALEDMLSISASDPLGAARLLYEFALKSETYVPTVDEKWSTYPLHMDSGPSYNYWGGLWSRWSLSELGSGLRRLSDTLVNVNKTDALDVLSQELSLDVKQKIVEEMLLPAYAFTQSFPVNMGNQDHANMRGMVSIGKALNDPDYIHHAVDWISQWIETKLLADGFWPEIALNYHTEAINGLRTAVNSITGYSDPAGYVSPRTGDTYTNLNLLDEYPIIGKSVEISRMMTYPDGKYLPTQDTWANTSSSSPLDTGSMLLPSAGIGKMTLGRYADQTQLYMTFGPKLLGHNHYDPLNLVLYAEGQELLPDIGYTNTTVRGFSLSTLGHNTVTVDGANMAINADSEMGGAIETFVTMPDELTVIRADQKSAYAQTTEYSREPWLIRFGDEGESQGYVLDIFRVAGGDRHEYTLQGDANRDAEFVTDMTLTPYGASLAAPGESAHYEKITDVDQAALTGEQYEVTLETEGDSSELARLHITGLLEDSANQLFLGRAPSIRETRLKGSTFDNNTPENETTMPKLIQRREGTNISSTFVTVMEPYQEANGKKIDSVERLALDTPIEGAVAVKVVYGNTTDMMLSNPRHPETPLTIGDITMSGELGFIRLVNGEVSKMMLVGGTLLQAGESQITGEGIVTGTITGTKRLLGGDPVNGLVTTTAVSRDTIGKYVVVQHPDETTHAYQIGDILNESGLTTIVLEAYDPGFDINPDGSSQWKYFPNTYWGSGSHTFRIADVAASIRHSDHVAVVGQPVEATGSDGGVMYMVPKDTASTPVALAQAVTLGQGISVPAVANEPVMLSTGGLSQGSYKLHLVTNAGAVRSGTGAIDLLDPYAERIEEDHSLVRTAGTWNQTSQNPSNSGGYGISSNVTDSYVEITFFGKQAIVIGAKNASYGIADVWIDGEPHGQIDYYKPGGIARGQEVYDTGLLEEGFHTIRLTVTGTKHPSSGNTYVSFDALKLVGHEDSSVPILWDVTAGPLEHTEQVTAKSTKTGTLYLVPSTTAANKASIEAAGAALNGTSVTIASIGKSVTLNPYGYLSGSYTVYAIDTEGNVSAASNPIAINGTSLSMLRGPALVGQPVEARSLESATLYLVLSDIEASPTALSAAVLAGQGTSLPAASGTSTMLPTLDLSAGAYKVYAVNELGAVTAGFGTLYLLDPYAERIEEDHAIVHTSGTWNQTSQNSANSGGYSILSNVKDSYVEIPFFGRQAIVIGAKNTVYGIADVVIDGVPHGQIDYYRPNNIARGQEVYDTGLLEEGLHTIRLTVTGTRSPGSGNTHVVFDALKLVGHHGSQAPIVWDVTTGPIEHTEQVTAKSTKTGTLYLVTSATEATAAAIQAAAAMANGTSAPITIGVPIALHPNGFLTGNYKVYAIDTAGNVSAGSADILISGIAISMQSGPAVVGQTVTAASYDSGVLYMVPQETEPTPAALAQSVTLGKGRSAPAVANVSVSLDTYGLSQGNYNIHLVTTTGDVRSVPDSIDLLDPYAERIEENHSLVRYSGTWIQESEHGGNSGGFAVTSNVQDSYVEIPFFGKQAIVIGAKHPDYGIVEVSVDGAVYGLINLYNAGGLLRGQELFDTGLLEDGPHLLRLTVTGTTYGTGTGVSFDALKLPGREESSAPILWDVTTGPVEHTGQVSAKSTKTGTLYLVPSATAANKVSIEAAGAAWNGASAAIPSIGVPVMLHPHGFLSGSYTLYAIDTEGNVSAASSPIAINGTTLSMFSGLALVGQPVQAVSGENVTLYLVSSNTAGNPSALAAAVSAGQGTSLLALAGTPVEIATSALPMGVYKLYAVNDLGAVATGHGTIYLLDPYAERIEEDHAIVHTSGTWNQTSQNSANSGGYAISSKVKDSYVEIPFFGRQAIVIAAKNTVYGIADVSIDGVPHGQIDYYRPNNIARGQEVYDTGILEEGLHTIRLTVTGTRNPGSGDTLVHFDALKLIGHHASPAPIVWDVTTGLNASGHTEQVTAKSTKTGTLYLVPSGTAANAASIIAASAGINGTSASIASVGVNVTMIVQGIAPGSYTVYAIDAAGNVSAGSDVTVWN